MVLVNAIYFKGNWLTEFDKSKTQKDTFTLESNETVQADMMTLKAEFSHGYFKDVQARVLKVFFFLFLKLKPFNHSFEVNLMFKLKILV